MYISIYMVYIHSFSCFCSPSLTNSSSSSSSPPSSLYPSPPSFDHAVERGQSVTRDQSHGTGDRCQMSITQGPRWVAGSAGGRSESARCGKTWPPPHRRAAQPNDSYGGVRLRPPCRPRHLPQSDTPLHPFRSVKP